MTETEIVYEMSRVLLCTDVVSCPRQLCSKQVCIWSRLGLARDWSLTLLTCIICGWYLWRWQPHTKHTNTQTHTMMLDYYWWA